MNKYHIHTGPFGVGALQIALEIIIHSYSFSLGKYQQYGTIVPSDHFWQRLFIKRMIFFTEVYWTL
jgi:hypothetical protein